MPAFTSIALGAVALSGAVAGGTMLAKGGAGGGATIPPSPAPTANQLAGEEKQLALAQEQIDLLKGQRADIAQQRREQGLLAPLLYKQAGIQPQFNERGELIGYTEIDDPLVAKRKEVEAGLIDRELAALKGELPTDPSLVKSLTEDEFLLHEDLLKRIGPGYQLSTPGMEALSKFATRKALVLDASRRGDLTLAQGLNLSREEANRIGSLDVTNRLVGAQAYPYTSSAMVPGLVAAYGNPINALNLGINRSENRSMAQWNAEQMAAREQEILRAQGRAALISGGLGLAGAIGGAYAGRRAG